MTKGRKSYRKLCHILYEIMGSVIMELLVNDGSICKSIVMEKSNEVNKYI